MNPVGIMQGRLSHRQAQPAQCFPWLSWQEEFAQARACGFDCIEWLLTADRLDDNPIWSDEGAREMRRHIAATGVGVTSVCADCFIHRPFVRVSDHERRANEALLERLVVRCAEIGIEVLLIPVLEGSAIRDRDEGRAVLSSLERALPIAESGGVKVALESDLPGQMLEEWIAGAGLPALGVYYDVGNAVAAGHDAVADVNRLAPLLCGVHIKDRKRAGPSTALGEGDVDFAGFLRVLNAIRYSGPLILETPSGDDPLDCARRNRAFIGRA